MRRLSFFIVLGFLSVIALPPLPVTQAADFTLNFSPAIDGLSAHMEEHDAPLHVSAWTGTQWTPWEELAHEEEHPTTPESNLVLFAHPVALVRFDREIARDAIHPIRVSNAPAAYRVAGFSAGAHHVLSRSEWGADESLLVSNGSPASNVSDESSGDAPLAQSSQRVQDCKNAYANYPNEFKASASITKNAAGQTLRWPLQYSPQVRMLVIHHTAMKVAGDTRSGAERMRALYQYHAVNRGWGDVGYNFIVDETGQIYEGKSGGDYVVAGHAYCNNIGTVGIALMGNFDSEQPTQAQVQSLQWLLKLLAEKYKIDPNKNVTFHGKDLPPIVGHRQLLSTECPGLMMWSVLDQIRAHVRTGDVDALVDFPDIAASPETGTGGALPANIVTGGDGLAALTNTTIQGRPGADVIIPIFFRATTKDYLKNVRLARVTRMVGMDVWQEREGTFVPVVGDLKLPVPLLKQGEAVLLRVKVHLPLIRGNAMLTVGTIRYTFELSGRVARTRQLINTSGMQQLPENGGVRQTSRPVGLTRLRPEDSAGQARGGTSSSMSSTAGNTIRILLSGKAGMNCEGARTALSPQYRGTLQCQNVDGVQVLINELSLENYLLGLAEEPDTEPYEKQRAFAIAARTYALYYMDPAHRKFPGKPYDGSDDPATFQKYQGITFEPQNPSWVRAVLSTANVTLTYNGSVIKPPYFSSDDGRTRTPAEAHWVDFPFAQIFTAKDDPWCKGMPLRGHGVGMSGCGALGQARDGKTAEQILQYYYPGTQLAR